MIVGEMERRYCVRALMTGDQPQMRTEMAGLWVLWPVVLQVLEQGWKLRLKQSSGPHLQDERAIIVL